MTQTLRTPALDPKPAVAALATLGAAELLYRWVEKPSVELAKRLKGSREEPAPAVPGTRMAA